jgi:ABC-type antimicrobial peptide transport system permease subunit
MMHSMKILFGQPLRLALTVGGIALCVILMLFLLAAYKGVADGSVEYIRRNKADLWVLQENSWNILRQSSVLMEHKGARIENVFGVDSVSGVLFILGSVKVGDGKATVYLTGFDPEGGMGGPPHIVEGRTVAADDEIVLDRSFASKFGFSPGDVVKIQDKDLEVVGISSGTNAFVIQYAFVTLEIAREILGLPGIVTSYLVSTAPGEDVGEVRGRILSEVGGVSVYDHPTFLENNIREMQTGFLPFIFTIAAIGVVVLTVILCLLLTINILERRKDFAVLKTLGSPVTFLPGVIAWQAVLISMAACAVAIALFFPMTTGIEKIVPEVSTRTSPLQIVGVIALVNLVGLVSSAISMGRLRRIYALEAFS